MNSELNEEIWRVLNDLRDFYCADNRNILTESDVISRAYHLFMEKDIPKKFDTSLHCELGPFNPESNEVIRNEGWESEVPLNYASKFDLALIDNNPRVTHYCAVISRTVAAGLVFD